MPFLEAIASLQARKPQLIPNGANFKFSEELFINKNIDKCS